MREALCCSPCAQQRKGASHQCFVIMKPKSPHEPVSLLPMPANKQLTEPCTVCTVLPTCKSPHTVLRNSQCSRSCHWVLRGNEGAVLHEFDFFLMFSKDHPGCNLSFLWKERVMRRCSSTLYPTMPFKYCSLSCTGWESGVTVVLDVGG